MNEVKPMFEFAVDQSETSGAMLSDDKVYRYALWRVWDKRKPYALFVLLNPSTADAEMNDPTVTRLIKRARNAGHGALVVVNAFAYRATDPDTLKRFARDGGNPIGPMNDETIAKWAKHAQAAILGWGRHCDDVVPGRSKAIIDLLAAIGVPTFAIGVNNDGSPKHPLYAAYNDLPVVFGR